MPHKKVCLVWVLPSGEIKRTRFFKRDSTTVIARKRESIPYKTKDMTKREWVQAYGEVDPTRNPPAANYDIRFEKPTPKMRMWRHMNKRLYRNSIF